MCTETPFENAGRVGDDNSDDMVAKVQRTRSAAARQRRQINVWLSTIFALLFVALVIGLISGRTGTQINYLLTGVNLLVLAVFVWVTGLMGMSYSRFGGREHAEVRELTWPRWLVVTVLVLAGIVLVVAALPGRVGSSAGATSHSGFVVVNAVESATEWFGAICLYVGALLGLKDPQLRGVSAFFLALIAAAYGSLFLLHLVAPGYAGLIWSAATGPFHDLWNWTHGR